MKTATTNKAASAKMLEWILDRSQVDEVCRRVEKAERKRKRRKAAAASIASLLVVGLGLAWGVPYIRETQTVVTENGRRQVLVLQDGSKAVLNAQTEVFTDFRGNLRTVRLDRGEAFFAVAKDTAHPFVVHTPYGKVQVTGTQFNVRLVDGKIDVTLVEGHVNFVQDRAPPVELQPGEQLDSQNTTPRQLNADQLEEVIAWKDGRAVFHGATLEQAVRSFARYHGKTIWLAPQVQELRLGGSFALDDLPGFISAMEEMLPVKVLRAEDGSSRVYPR